MADFKKLKDGQGNSYNVKDEQARTNLASHTSNTSNPHSVTKAQVGLGNVDNTSDANKPISNAQAAVNAAKFDKANVKATPGSTPSDDNVVSEKYSEETYGKKDGNYPTMTVGAADNLTPYDESAGDDQDDPFLFQATGTGNGSQADFATGALALMKEKRGNSVVVNQHVVSPSTELVRTMGSQYSENGYSCDKLLKDHYYLKIGKAKSTISGYYLFVTSDNVWETLQVAVDLTSSYQTFYSIYKPNYNFANSSFVSFRAIDPTGAQEGAELSTKDVYNIDLTQWFGSNDAIPADLLAHPENFFRYYQGSLAYNTGQIVNANSRYIKCIGRNLCDNTNNVLAELVAGNTTTGTNCVTDYIRVIPGLTYNRYSKSPTALSGEEVAFYDKDKNYIDRAFTAIFTVPANCFFIRSEMPSNSGSLDGAEQCISIYYEDESGYDQYYPYEVLTNNDTGTEELKSAGSVADSKTPDGTITRRVGTHIFNNTETLTGQTELGGYRWVSISLTNCFNNSSQVSRNLILIDFKPMPTYDATNGCFLFQGEVWLGYDKSVYENDNAFRASLNGKTLYYELATPTTEQGTPFSENLVIDDFGSMDFSGTSGVPQGNLIFYPVDYKAFIDTLYDYADGTPSDLAKKSDLTPLENQDTILQNAIGGTLRQCLCIKETLDFEDTAFVDLGEQTWTYNGNNVFEISLSSVGDKGLSTKYERVDTVATENQPDKTIQVRTGLVYVKDSSYTDATAFKNAMKGVLLAYEKASE